ncbi:MAG: hypothetical protein HYY45_17375 [Deltaproteobacteria bacterium]|nr:hypothetical protein [Deltaproteobacteria bacterium]
MAIATITSIRVKPWPKNGAGNMYPLNMEGRYLLCKRSVKAHLASYPAMGSFLKHPSERD